MIDWSVMTEEEIMKRCLEKVGSDIDKREGSLIYDALAPAAAELATMYMILSAQMDRAFPDTATNEDLTNKVKERGIFRLPATASVRKGEFTWEGGQPREIPVGSRFSGGGMNYAVMERVSSTVYHVKAEEPGTEGNEHFGILFPIDYVEGLASATLTDILIPGEDEEEDEKLRARYMESLKNESFGGNIADYREKTQKLPGVGAVKVFPVWDGGGTVKLVFTTSEGGIPSTELVASVQESIDPDGFAGQGKGLAPIGHDVTVKGVEKKAVDVSMSLTFESGYIWDSVKDSVVGALEAYLKETIAVWADLDSIIVRISQMEAKVLSVNGIVDIKGTTVNGMAENLTLTAEEIPILGVVNHIEAH